MLNRASGLLGDLDLYTAENALRAMDGVWDVAVIPNAEGSGAPSADCALVLDASVDESRTVKRACGVLAESGVTCRHVRAVGRIPYSLSGKIRTDLLTSLMGGIEAMTPARPPG